MTIKTHYLFWLLLAVIAGAWPLMLPAAHGNAPSTHAAVVDANANA